MSTPVGVNDGALIVDKFEEFVKGRDGQPFLSPLFFHNNHIPFVATAAGAAACSSGAQCPPGSNFSAKQLDYFGALVDIDEQIGRVRTILKQLGYSDSTLVWLASDNGPEVNVPEGEFSPGVPGGGGGGPGEGRPLRGRKRDYWEVRHARIHNAKPSRRNCVFLRFLTGWLAGCYAGRAPDSWGA